MAPSPSAVPKNQYHHCIPRFILRQFLTGPQPPTNRRQRTRSFYKAYKSGEDLDTIFFYDLSTGILQNRPLSKVYGKINLYRDMKDPTNVDHLEVKLARLEQEASLVINRIRIGVQNQSFALSRKELATLRKFIFLMHYRNDGVSSTYFQENNPNNAPLADWIRKYKKTHKLQTDFDIWLDGMKYYLDTPHSTIVAEGERLRERYGDRRFQEMLRKRLDPDIQEWYAIDYESLANYFFLGVWEAANNTEFVLAGNGFGLWEGLIYGSPGAHRLYVVSPRIAIVLRRTFLRQPHSNDPSVLYSCLADIPISPPNTKYADESVFTDLYDVEDPAIRKNVLDTYRSSAIAQDDLFTFGITKLTGAQTHAVNEVIMMNANLHPEGSLTFASPTIMLETLKAYMTSHNTFLGGKRSLFRPLLLELSNMIYPGFSTGGGVPSLETPWDVDTDADLQLHMFLRFTVMKGISFPSLYNRAYLVYHMSTDIATLSNPVSSQIRSTRNRAISKLKLILDPPLPGLIDAADFGKTLVQTLPLEESELFFAIFGHQIDQLEVGRQSNDMLANIIYEAAVIGVAYWIAANRPDVLADLLWPWITVLV